MAFKSTAADDAWKDYFDARGRALKSDDPEERERLSQEAAEEVLRTLDVVEPEVAASHSRVRGQGADYYTAVMESQARYLRRVPVVQVLRMTLAEQSPNSWVGEPIVEVVFETPIAEEAEAELTVLQRLALQESCKRFGAVDAQGQATSAGRSEWYSVRFVMPGQERPPQSLARFDFRTRVHNRQQTEPVPRAWPVTEVSCVYPTPEADA